MTITSKRLLAAVSSIGLAATLASCQLPGGSSGEKGASTSTSASAPKSAQPGGDSNSSQGAAIESHTSSIDSKPATVSLNSVSATGTTVTVMFSVTNDDKSNDMYVSDYFSDGDDSIPQPAERRHREEVRTTSMESRSLSRPPRTSIESPMTPRAAACAPVVSRSSSNPVRRSRSRRPSPVSRRTPRASPSPFRTAEPSATWRWPDETADEWGMGKGHHVSVSVSVRGACSRSRRRVGNIVVDVRLGCCRTCSTASGPPVGGGEQQLHSRSNDDHQATGERRAG